MIVFKVIQKIIQEWKEWFDKMRRKPQKSYVVVRTSKSYY